MVIIVEGIDHNTIWVELAETAGKGGMSFGGSNKGVTVKAFLRAGQQFLTENDIVIEGQALTTVEEVADQLNEHLEEDY